MAHEDKILDHLSKEIEAYSHNAMIFRTTANLSVFVGPFVILGYILVGTKGVFVSWQPDTLARVALLVLGVCFIGLGIIAGQIEDSMSDQCNKWRAIIARLQREPTPTLQHGDLIHVPRFTRGYAITYALLLVSLTSVIVVIRHLKLG
jgi:hypothetical protein